MTPNQTVDDSYRNSWRFSLSSCLCGIRVGGSSVLGTNEASLATWWPPLCCLSHLTTSHHSHLLLAYPSPPCLFSLAVTTYLLALFLPTAWLPNCPLFSGLLQIQTSHGESPGTYGVCHSLASSSPFSLNGSESPTQLICLNFAKAAWWRLHMRWFSCITSIL